MSWSCFKVSGLFRVLIKGLAGRQARHDVPDIPVDVAGKFPELVLGQELPDDQMSILLVGRLVFLITHGLSLKPR